MKKWFNNKSNKAIIHFFMFFIMFSLSYLQFVDGLLAIVISYVFLISFFIEILFIVWHLKLIINKKKKERLGNFNEKNCFNLKNDNISINNLEENELEEKETTKNNVCLFEDGSITYSQTVDENINEVICNVVNADNEELKQISDTNIITKDKTLFSEESKKTKKKNIIHKSIIKNVKEQKTTSYISKNKKSYDIDVFNNGKRKVDYSFFQVFRGFIGVVIVIYILINVVNLFSFDSCSNAIEDNEENLINYELFNDEYLMNDFITVLSEINADEKKISCLEKKDDWVDGPRYSFLYDGKIIIYVYCNMTSTIESLNYKDIKIYSRGFESYDINEYLYKQSVIDSLIFHSIDIVSAFLNYPLTADFKYTSTYWNYYRDKNIYYLSSFVDAKNAFGVEERLYFKVAYSVELSNDKINNKLIYLLIDDKIILNNIDLYRDKTVRKKVEPKNPELIKDIGEGINLVYNQLGEYGKYTTIDGEKIICYYVPYGEYLVRNNGNAGAVIVASDEMFINLDGYYENVDFKIYRFDIGSNGETFTIDVPKKYHIEISSNTNVIFEEIK